MALTYRKLAEYARYRLGAGVKERLRFQTFVKDALQKLADKIPLDNNRRGLLKTVRSTTTAILTAGVADLTTIVTASPYVNLNRIRYGEIYHGPSLQPLEWLPDGGTMLLEDSLDSDFVAYWMEGNKLYTKGTMLADLTVPAASVTAATDTIAYTAHGLATGQAVYFTGASLPAGLTASTVYFVVKVDADSFKVATTYANAVAGTAVDITTAGTGNHTLSKNVLQFAVPFVPTLTTLPVDLESALIDEVIAIAKTGQGSGWIEGKEDDFYDKPQAILE